MKDQLHVVGLDIGVRDLLLILQRHGYLANSFSVKDDASGEYRRVTLPDDVRIVNARIRYDDVPTFATVSLTLESDQLPYTFNGSVEYCGIYCPVDFLRSLADSCEQCVDAEKDEVHTNFCSHCGRKIGG